MNIQEPAELSVPSKKITLTNGETVSLYCTEGPENTDLKKGLPKRRAEWIQKRKDRGDRNFSQMHYARKG
ncbi:MAG TPA: phosphomethylpyrimidine synthase, partial [Leptospiraceae bacterium]|nr:phosphomethylpyrimidine synthase [Leptospiraceae bacterium]